MNCNTTHYRANSSSVPGDPTRQINAAIAAKRVNIPEDEARDLTRRAVQFNRERGRRPDINATDAWEGRMAEGVAALAKYTAQRKASGG